ncbi:DegV family protein [Acetoanaerobium noterae]|uniref:DegV family protein n=1 Tax=Acetoanaerobium noterae TaxID=745369 RepID=UPI00322208E0
MKIVADSSCDLTAELKKELDVTLVPLTIRVGEKNFRDDETLNLDEMMRAIKAHDKAAQSACPSPQDFIDAFGEAKSVFVVTMTAALSGTYNSAMKAKELFQEETENSFVHIFNSKGSSVKETMIAVKLKELIDMKLTESDIVEKTEHYIENMKYIFQLGSLDTMIKNGRVSKLKGMIANVLNIRPILCSSPEGEVELIENVRSEKKSLRRLVELIGEMGDNFEDKILGISHCYSSEKAEYLKKEIESRYPFKKVFIVPMAGLSSLYTNEGGITIAF